MEPRRGVADVPAAGQQNAVSYYGVALGGDHCLKPPSESPTTAYSSVAKSCAVRYQRLGAFVDPQAAVSELQDG
jgi:hypothetical protein